MGFVSGCIGARSDASLNVIRRPDCAGEDFCTNCTSGVVDLLPGDLPSDEERETSLEEGGNGDGFFNVPLIYALTSIDLGD